MSSLAAPIAMKIAERVLERVMKETPAKKVKKQMKKPQKQMKNKGKGKAVTRSADAPVRRSETAMFKAPVQLRGTKKKGRTGIEIAGCEFLGPIWGTSSQLIPSYATLTYFGLNPSFFVGTRLSILALTWQKFIFRKFVVHYSSTCGSSQGGAFLWGYWSDPGYLTGLPPTSLPYVQAVTSTASAKITPYWEDSSFACPLDVDKEYYVQPEAGGSGDDRLSIQGELATIDVGTGVPQAQAPGLGVIWIEYEIEFLDPAVSAQTFNRSVDLITSATGGISSNVTITCNPSIAFGSSVTTVYELVPLQSFSGLKAGVIYYVTCTGSLSVSFNLYTSPQLTNQVPGPYLIPAYPPLITYLWRPLSGDDYPTLLLRSGASSSLSSANTSLTQTDSSQSCGTPTSLPRRAKPDVEDLAIADLLIAKYKRESQNDSPSG